MALRNPESGRRLKWMAIRCVGGVILLMCFAGMVSSRPSEACLIHLECEGGPPLEGLVFGEVVLYSMEAWPELGGDDGRCVVQLVSQHHLCQLWPPCTLALATTLESSEPSNPNGQLDPKDQEQTAVLVLGAKTTPDHETNHSSQPVNFVLMRGACKWDENEYPKLEEADGHTICCAEVNVTSEFKEPVARASCRIVYTMNTDVLHCREEFIKLQVRHVYDRELTLILHFSNGMRMEPTVPRRGITSNTKPAEGPVNTVPTPLSRLAALERTVTFMMYAVLAVFALFLVLVASGVCRTPCQKPQAFAMEAELHAKDTGYERALSNIYEDLRDVKIVLTREEANTNED